MPQHSETGLLDVGGGQRVHWEASGAPDGIPLLYLHGGPGGGLGTGGYRRRADPARFRVIGLDQRGCGRSSPHASAPGYDLAENTTGHLIADLERLREHLGIEAWVLNGVSWGSTLALAYATTHPDRVLGIVLMAVTTTRRTEVDWITETVGALYPEAFDAFASHAEDAGTGYLRPDPVTGERRSDVRLVEAYARLAADPDPAVHGPATRAWADWEDWHIAIGAGTAHGGTVQHDARWEDDAFRIAFVRLTTHYWAHDGFLDPPLLERADRLAGIPGVLIHGRTDVSGPAQTAWELHRRWPGSELILDEGEGHGGAAMVAAWTAANDRLADRLEGQGAGAGT